MECPAHSNSAPSNHMLDIAHILDADGGDILDQIALQKGWTDEDRNGFIRTQRLTPYEALDAWLTYEGIIGYTQQILEVAQTLNALVYVTPDHNDQ